MAEEPTPSAADQNRERRRASRRASEYNTTTPFVAAMRPKGGDKTASWVADLASSPPPPPPVEGTIIDAPVHFAAVPDDGPDPYDNDPTTTAREMRRSKRDSAAAPRSSRRDDPPSQASSGGGGGAGYHRRGQSYAGPSNSLGYNDMNSREAAAGATPASKAKKAGGWLKKLAGL
jgi:hypothetical protein